MESTREAPVSEGRPKSHFGTVHGVAIDAKHHLEAAMSKMGLGTVIQISEAIERMLVEKVCDILGWNDQEKKQ